MLDTAKLPFEMCMSHLQGKKLRQQKKAKLAARTKLSFAQEEDEEEDTEQNGSAKVCWHRSRAEPRS